LRARWGHRQPRQWAANFGLYSNDGSGTINTQAIVDAEILDAYNAGGPNLFWMFDWYPTDAMLGADGPQDASTIDTAYNAYLASPNKSKIKFALMVAPTWLGWPNNTFAHAQAQYDYLATIMADSQYLKIGGQPVLFVYEVLNSTNLPQAQWTQLKATTGAIFAVSAADSVSSIQNYSLQAGTTYGPNPSLPGGSSRTAWSAQATADSNGWGAVPGAQCAVSLTPVQDRRPIGTTTYRDQPTQPEWMRHLRNARNFTQAGVGAPKLGLIYSHSEVAEGGPFNSIQETSPTTTYSRYYDAMGWELGGIARPASYVYEISLSNVGGSVTHSGTGWVTHQPTPGQFGTAGVSGAHDSDEEWSSTANDTITFAHEMMFQLAITGTSGPDTGKFSVSIDGGAPVTVDTYAASPTVHATLWTSSILLTEAHTVVITVLGTKNASSSGTTVKLDTGKVTFSPDNI
jgi:hypothetical protein